MDVPLDVRTAGASGRLIFSYQCPDKSEINRPPPQAVLTRAHASSYYFGGSAGANLRS
jgi:hypothetical protein